MRKVARLPCDPGRAGWNALLPPPSPARILEGDTKADWLVVGGGFAGLSAARRLSQLRPEDRIVLVDATRIGEGPAGRNSGFMVDLPHKLSSEDYAGAADADRVQTELNRAAIAFAAEAAEEYGLSEEAYCRPGKVNGAATARGMEANRSYAEHLDALGEPHELLDARDMRALTGSAYYLGGLRTPGTALIQPALYVRGLAKGLSRAIEIHEDTPVIAFEQTGPDWRAVTPKGSITAPRLILGVNGHAESFGYFRRRLVHIHLYASMTRALSQPEVKMLGGAPRWGVTPSDPVGSTVRRISGTGGDRIVVRNQVTYTPRLSGAERHIDKMGRRHDRSLVRRFPRLDGIEAEHRWGGRLCLSLNDVPAFGEIEKGVYSACCQNGLGTTKGTASGMLAAELAAQGNSPLLAPMMAMEAPKKLPPAPIAWLGATATLALKQWRAGREI